MGAGSAVSVGMVVSVGGFGRGAFGAGEFVGNGNAGCRGVRVAAWVGGVAAGTVTTYGMGRASHPVNRKKQKINLQNFVLRVFY